jgi:hypothetical protein
MIVYRSVRKTGESFWTIECFDRENQISYAYDKLGDEPHEFASKQSCERYIMRRIIKSGMEPHDYGEFGMWLTPELFPDGTF